MDSNFFFPVTVHFDGISTATNIAPWFLQLPIMPPQNSIVAVLVSTEGNQQQGMYLYDTSFNRWRYILPYEVVCDAIIFGSALDAYLSVDQAVTPSDTATIYRNGVLFNGTVIDTTPTVVWAVITPPAQGGAGTVQTVNGQSPDSNGNVVIQAIPSNLSAGTSLITDSGASDGTIQLRNLVAGSNVTFSEDQYGNLEISSTGGGGGGSGTVTSVGLALPSIFNVTNSPVTVSGTLTATLQTQAANAFFAGPSTGAAQAPTFRAIDSADLPLATTSAAGAVIVGSGLNVTAGTVSAAVQSVNGLTGAVVVKAEDNNDTSGTTLIVDSGATDGTIKLKTIVAGTNISLSTDANGNLEITGQGGTGTVQSVALTMPSLFAVAGSPVTSTGTLAVTLQGQNANVVFAGPTNGSANPPTFRALVGADLPLATTTTQGAVIVGAGLSVTAGTVSAAVTSVAGRTGAVVLAVADVSGAAPLASPALTGTPTGPTATVGTNNTQLATTAFVQAAITGFDLPPATATTLGGVIIPAGSGLTVNGSGDLSANVLSVAGRTGAVVLAVADVSGAAPLASPALTGTPTAPTATAGTNTTQIATTAFVEAAIAASGVSSFNTRTGAVTLQAADVTGVGGALLAGPAFTGTPTAPTATAGTNTTQLATTAFVTGAVTGLAPLASPAFTGVPTAPTAANTTNTTQIATTAFVQSLIASSGVSSFNTRTGAVTLQAADVTAVGGALLASPAFTGTPTVPTASAGTNTTQAASTAFVSSAISTAITPLATLASPTFTGTPAAPTAAPGTNTTQLATTAFVEAAVQAATLPPATTTTLGAIIVGSGLSVTGGGTLSANVTSVAGRTGAITLAVADVSGAAPVASPTFTGVPAAPTAAQGDASTQIATDAFVYNAISGSSTVNVTGNVGLTASQYSVPVVILQGNVTGNFTVTFPSSGVWSVINNCSISGTLTLAAGNGSGNTVSVTTTNLDVTASGNSLFLSNDQAVTRALNDDTNYIATTAFVANAIGALSSGVTSFNTRVGAVTLQAADVSGVGGALLASPTFTGVPAAPTASAGTSTTQIATTQFVSASFAPLASPALTGTPTAPTATPGTSTTQLATTAFVATSYAPIASPAFTGIPTAPAPTQGTNTGQLATTSFVQQYLQSTVNIGLSGSNVTLTAAQYSSEIIEFTGTLTASVVITVPTSGQWIFYNNTTGSFNVTVSNGSGSAYAIPQNESASLVSLTSLGVLNSNIAGNTITPATATTIGGVIVPNGGGLTINAQGDLSAAVQSVFGRTGAVVLTAADITGAGGAVLASPAFTGTPTAPTATAGTNTTQLATTAFVQAAVGSYAPVASPAFTGTPTAPTPAAGSNNTDIATAAYVYNAMQTPVSIPVGSLGTTYSLTAAQYSATTLVFTGAVAGGGLVVTVPTTGAWDVINDTTGGTLTFTNGTGANLVFTQSTNVVPVVSTTTGALGVVTIPGGGSTVVNTFNSRSGAVTLTAADVTGVGGALLASPAFTGTPTAPTASVGTNTTQIATTAFVTGSYAPLASPALTGTPTAPTQAIGVNNTDIATTAYVYGVTQGSASIALTNANVTLTAAQYSVPVLIFTGTLTANVVVTVPTTGEWIVYNETTGAFTVTLSNGTGATQVVPQSSVATSPYISNVTAGVIPVTPVVSGVSSFNTRTGAVTLAAADVTGVGGALLASPAFTGTPTAPTATAGTNTTQIATTAFVTAAGYAPLASPTFTGTPAAPTATAGTSTTQIATTAFVATSFAPLASPQFTGVPQIPASTYPIVTVTPISGTATFNLNAAAEFTITISAATTFAFGGAPATGFGAISLIRIVNGGAGPVSWPNTVLFAGGTAPTLTTSGNDLIGVRWDGTANVFCVFVIGLNLLT
jgi:hypothetical protein